MAIASGAEYSELFRFATVRNPTLADDTARKKRFIELKVDEPTLRAFPAQPAILIRELRKLFGKARWAQSVATALDDFQDSPRRFKDIADLPAAYGSEFRRVSDELQVQPDSKEADLRKLLKTENIDPKLFVARQTYADELIQLWENVIALYLRPGDAELRDAVIACLRWYWVLGRLNNNDPLLSSDSDVRSATHATVLIPEFALPPREPEEELAAPAPERKSPARGGAGDSYKRVRDLRAALDEVNKVFQQQLDPARRVIEARKPRGGGPVIVAPPEGPPEFGNGPDLVRQPMLDQLSAQTLSVLQSLDAKRANFPMRLIRQRFATAFAGEYDAQRMQRGKGMSVKIRSAVVHLDDECAEYMKTDPCAVPPRQPIPKTRGRVSSQGVADLRVVRSELWKYELGEIAQIENILLGETKTHTFRTLSRSERTQVDESETTTEQEKDLQTTDRFELSQESSNVIKDDLKFDAGVTLTADFGSVKLGTSANFATSHASEESNKIARKQASEVVSKAVSRITERVRKQVTTVTILETDELDKRELANPTKAGADHVSGIYRWVDKYYTATIYNYGKRYLLEFLVPEPAAFHIYSKAARPATEDAIPRPQPPLNPDDGLPLTSHRQITPENVGVIAAPYNAMISAPPDAELVVGVSLKNSAVTTLKDDDNKDMVLPMSSEENKELLVPKGYVAMAANVQADGSIPVSKTDTGDWWNPFDDKQVIQKRPPVIGTVIVGQCVFPIGQSIGWKPMSGEVSKVPVSVLVSSTHFVLNAEVLCARTDRHLEEWQMATFNTILEAYEAKLKAYRDWKSREEIQDGPRIEGDNPAINRQTEAEELKRCVLEILTGQRFDAFGAIAPGPLGYPEMDFDRARQEGRYVQFFEQAFEWANMTYLFYPYFWGRKPRWVVTREREDTDPIFTKFLQAGYARVVVPVRLAYTKAMKHFLASPVGEIWLGEDVPVPSDALYISIADEMKEEAGDYEKAKIESRFTIKVPTNLVMLQSNKLALPNNPPPP